MSEWLKELAWKASKGQPFESSNLSVTATSFQPSLSKLTQIILKCNSAIKLELSYKMIISNIFRFIFYLISTKLNEGLSLFVLIAALHFVLLLDMFFLFRKNALDDYIAPPLFEGRYNWL